MTNTTTTPALQRAIFEAIDWLLDDAGRRGDYAYYKQAVITTAQDALARKDYAYFLRVVTRAVTAVYDGNLGGEFIGIMEDLILGQISQAFETAWTDDGNEPPPPDFLREASQAMVLEQQGYVEGYYRDIVDARVDGTPLDPLLSRAELWANRYNDAYNEAVALITAHNGGKLMWQYSPEKEHCRHCEQLNGIVAYATEWAALDIAPQSDRLECHGFRCGCNFVTTSQRRSPHAFETIMNILTG